MNESIEKTDGAITDKKPGYFDALKDKTSGLVNSFKEYTNSFSDIENDLLKIGYKITEIDVAVTVPPRISFKIDLLHSSIDPEVKKEVLDSAGIFFSTLMKTIDKTIEVQDHFSFQSKTLSGIGVELSFIPTVKLIYT